MPYEKNTLRQKANKKLIWTQPSKSKTKEGCLVIFSVYLAIGLVRLGQVRFVFIGTSIEPFWRNQAFVLNSVTCFNFAITLVASFFSKNQNYY